NEAEQNQVAEQHAPIGAEAGHQPRPAQLAGTHTEEVADVGPIEARALQYGRLRPHDFFHGTDQDGHTEYLAPGCVFEPRVIDHTNPVSRTENDVDEVFPVIRLGEPMRICDVSLIASVYQGANYAVAVPGFDENVQIL